MHRAQELALDAQAFATASISIGSAFPRVWWNSSFVEILLSWFLRFAVSLFALSPGVFHKQRGDPNSLTMLVPTADLGLYIFMPFFKIWEELNLTNLLPEKQYRVLIKNTTSGASLFGFGSSEALSGLLNLLTSVFLSVK